MNSTVLNNNINVPMASGKKIRERLKHFFNDELSEREYYTSEEICFYIPLVFLLLAVIAVLILAHIYNF